MLNFTLIGAGRIGKMHAQNIANHPLCNLLYIYDVNTELASSVAEISKAKIASNAEDAINDKDVDAVFIASATNTHIDYIILAAQAGKAIFCEKPIDLDINKVDYCRKKIKDLNVPIQIGFNRRFDPSHKKLKLSKDAGEIGKLEKIIITSRDPSPPSKEYLKISGGIFRDMAIHDFDFCRFILSNDPILEISAHASQLFSDDIKDVEDYDTSMVIMKSQSGVLCHINNSRRAIYGYDQRVEIFGSKGMLISNNQTPNSLEKYNATTTGSKELIYHFFIERYNQAYKDQLDDFVNMIVNKLSPNVTFEDGRKALIIANAAYVSLNNNNSSTKIIYD